MDLEKHLESDEKRGCCAQAEGGIDRRPTYGPPGRRSSRLVDLILLSAACLAFLAGRIYLFRPTGHHPIPVHCPQPDLIPLSKETRLLTNADTRRRAVTRLQEALRIPTVSYDDFGPPDHDPRWRPFDDMHAWLSSSFPLLFNMANVERVSKYTLILTLSGSSPDLKPTILMGHQDVVPVIGASDWKHPPFAGYLDETGWIYGRGAADDKSVLIGTFFAIENLLQAGWQPKRTLICVAHQDEEVRGEYGSAVASKLLLERLGEKGAAVVLDEGPTGLDGRPYGHHWLTPMISEKGYADLSLSVHLAGGHSATPKPHTAPGILAALVDALNKADRPTPQLFASHPLVLTAACIAQHGKEGPVPKRMRRIFHNGDLDKLIAIFDHSDSPTDHMTTWVPTIMAAGSKVNVVPPVANASFNFRLTIGDTIEKVNKSVVSILEDVLAPHTLHLGREVQIAWHDAEEAMPVSSVRSSAWTALTAAGRSVFPDALFAPSMAAGYSDSRRYTDVAKQVYEWRPAKGFDAHGTDERIHSDEYVKGIMVYSEFVLAMDRMEGDGEL